VPAIELGDLDRGYKAIDTSGNDERLYSLGRPLMLGTTHVASVAKGVGKNAGREIKAWPEWRWI
jgi:5'-nucleotidase